MLLRSLASTPVAMIAGVDCLGQGVRWIAGEVVLCLETAMMSLGAVFFQKRGHSGALQRGLAAGVHG